MMADAASLQLDPTSHQEQVLAWRRARVARLTAPDSWLSLIGKHWLEPGKVRVGSDPAADIVLPSDRAPSQLGTLELAAGQVTFEPAPGVVALLRSSSGGGEQSITGPVALRSDAKGPPDKVLVGSLSLEIMERASAFALRVRDSESPRRKNFEGIDYFPIDPALRVVATVEPHVPERRIELAYETGNAEEKLSPFAARFELDGVTVRVDLVPEGPQRYFLLFWDQTSRGESYGAGRFLYTAPPVGDRIVLDFNQAFNPPCAFTPFAACPLPPSQNRVPLPLRAGEKKPRDSDEA